MNANLGIILRKRDRELALSPVPPRFKMWRGEAVEEERPQRFVALGLDGVEFELFPVTKFIYGCLPTNEQTQELEYAWMAGPALDAYNLWAKANVGATALSSLEVGLFELLNRLKFWAVMFAPEGDRLNAFVSVQTNDAIRMLRRGMSDMATCEGFLAISY